ncbi:Dolichyl pyrophosphate Man9GlcNAc2 alpha-1,3-glucosyltransferase [Psilocybe cubensis]|uniref:Alpha-1,3-glucosyltransferase n=2 Tax=Psilocybe cubensis TaxID=181762 RepID=A0A8H7Y0Q2_PSICU|nr:Dolichyl pyrophosphate Man9GlcNAc2 alpha-1,3-glucosyltransferase [Psilocybe cubensis]KAH9480442.1 Dolichyl pyrophosphate Man9GlcNAc2 alpha-1,3-glucosyltransferase [Psilocybe cubensis]
MDADELSALPPEGSWKRSTRIRTTSLNPRYAYTNPSPATTRAESPFRPPYTSPDITHSDVPTILAPTPRRHLLESSASQHWLNTPPLSPLTSARALSPQSTTSTAFPFPFPPSASSSAHNTNNSSVRRRISASTHRRSFSALFEHDIKAGGASGPVSPGGRAVGSTTSTHTHTHKGHEPDERAMGRRWIRWMHKRGLKAWVVPAVLATSLLVKLAIGLGSYSGQGTPPMYGDYEAQRHWMELTVHLPMKQWYTYDLPYWGLDYPPLTAYVSWICGIVAHWINPAWVALDKSRGIESAESKVFMRMSVLVTDTLVYLPALLMFCRIWHGSRSKRTQELALLTLILQPALLLIDFGHFQYNAVMLGFTLLAMNFFATGQDLLGAFFFVLSLGFKQMALYYAPAIGSYLIAKCLYLGPTEGSRLFVRLAAVTAGTFIVLFLPWLPPFAPFTAIAQPIKRIFPFARGLFEDKVANFWCASNVVFKWKAWASASALVKLSTLLTAVGFLPGVVGLIRSGFKMQSLTKNKEPTPFLPLLPYALLTSSMSFFLFSFQVHEKTILLPLMPITLLLSGSPIDSAVYSWGALVNNVAVFSMWPLLKRDGLGVQYLAMLLLWNRLIGYNPIRIPPKSFIQLFSLAVYGAAIALHVLELTISPPLRYPDIYPVLNVLISTPVFFLTWLWSIKCGVEVGWAVGGLGKAGPARQAGDAGGGEGVGVSGVDRRNRVVSLAERPSVET